MAALGRRGLLQVAHGNLGARLRTTVKSMGNYAYDMSDVVHEFVTFNKLLHWYPEN